MDGPAFRALNRGLVIDGLTQQIEHTAQAVVTHRHADGRAGIGGFRATLQAVSGAHGDAANHIITDMLCNLGNDGAVPIGYRNGIQQRRQLAIRETNIQNRTHDLDHHSLILRHRIQLLNMMSL